MWRITDPAKLSLATIDACSGQVRSAVSYAYASMQSFTLPLAVDNVGISPVLTATCTLTVSIIRVNAKPVLTTTAFSIQEDSAVGTYVGQAAATDADPGDVVGGWTFTTVDIPDCFAISAAGVVTVKAVMQSVLLKSTYNYVLSMVRALLQCPLARQHSAHACDRKPGICRGWCCPSLTALAGGCFPAHAPTLRPIYSRHAPLRASAPATSPPGASPLRAD